MLGSPINLFPVGEGGVRVWGVCEEGYEWVRVWVCEGGKSSCVHARTIRHSKLHMTYTFKCKFDVAILHPAVYN